MRGIYSIRNCAQPARAVRGSNNTQLKMIEWGKKSFKLSIASRSTKSGLSVFQARTTSNHQWPYAHCYAA
jgi:hypothetical protein